MPLPHHCLSTLLGWLRTGCEISKPKLGTADEIYHVPVLGEPAYAPAESQGPLIERRLGSTFPRPSFQQRFSAQGGADYRPHFSRRRRTGHPPLAMIAVKRMACSVVGLEGGAGVFCLESWDSFWRTQQRHGRYSRSSSRFFCRASSI